MEESERKAAAAKSEATPASSSTARSLPEHEPQKESRAADDDADQIDVCSDKFDPLTALYSPTVAIPFPKIKCFNNVSEYESFLKGGRGRAKPENVEKKRLKAKRGVADPERIERLKRLMVNNPVADPEGGESSPAPPRRRQKPPKNVLTRMPRMSRRSHSCSHVALMPGVTAWSRPRSRGCRRGWPIGGAAALLSHQPRGFGSSAFQVI